MIFRTPTHTIHAIRARTETYRTHISKDAAREHSVKSMRDLESLASPAPRQSRKAAGNDSNILPFVYAYCSSVYVVEYV